MHLWMRSVRFNQGFESNYKRFFNATRVSRSTIGQPSVEGRERLGKRRSQFQQVTCYRTQHCEIRSDLVTTIPEYSLALIVRRQLSMNHRITSLTEPLCSSDCVLDCSRLD